MVIAKHDERITWFQNGICGGAAVISSRTATSPLEVVKILSQNLLEDPYQGYLSSTGSMLTGSASTLIAMLAVYPHETIRTGLVVQHVKPSLAKYHGMAHAFKTVWNKEGFMAM